jgi:hypothetical protein
MRGVLSLTNSSQIDKVEWECFSYSLYINSLECPPIKSLYTYAENPFLQILNALETTLLYLRFITGNVLFLLGAACPNLNGTCRKLREHTNPLNLHDSKKKKKKKKLAPNNDVTSTNVLPPIFFSVSKDVLRCILTAFLDFLGLSCYYYHHNYFLFCPSLRRVALHNLRSKTPRRGTSREMPIHLGISRRR